VLGIVGLRNSGTVIAVAPGMKRKDGREHPTDMMGWSNQPRAARVSFRSVFEVDGARLAIGHFNRPLDDAECRSLRFAWERAKLPEVVDFEVSRKQVSFLTPPKRVDETWREIDALLAGEPVAKAS
jgi:hypothetical protein